VSRGCPPLPEEAVAALRAMADAARAERGDTPANRRLDAYLASLRASGWSLRALGAALGVSYQRVEQRTTRTTRTTRVEGLPPAPSPPPRPVPPPPPPRPTVDAQMAERLRAMYEIARGVRGYLAADDPRRRVSEEFTATLASLVADGVPMGDLARAIGAETGTVRARLARHGYRHRPRSQPAYLGAPGHGRGDATGTTG